MITIRQRRLCSPSPTGQEKKHRQLFSATQVFALFSPRPRQIQFSQRTMAQQSDYVLPHCAVKARIFITHLSHGKIYKKADNGSVLISQNFPCIHRSRSSSAERGETQPDFLPALGAWLDAFGTSIHGIACSECTM